MAWMSCRRQKRKIGEPNKHKKKRRVLASRYDIYTGFISIWRLELHQKSTYHTQKKQSRVRQPLPLPLLSPHPYLFSPASLPLSIFHFPYPLHLRSFLPLFNNPNILSIGATFPRLIQPISTMPAANMDSHEVTTRLHVDELILDYLLWFCTSSLLKERRLRLDDQVGKREWTDAAKSADMGMRLVNCDPLPCPS